jgi:molybdopterin-guanine dinucleotide biosynthesis protein MobB
MTLKHGHHPADADRVGSDTWRHFHEGPAERTLIAAPDMRVLFERTPDDYDPIGLSRRYLDGADIILAEGFSRAPLPKVEVFRRAVASSPIYADGEQTTDRWKAIVTDDDRLRATCPVLRFNDTMWLQLLANLAWDGALILTA